MTTGAEATRAGVALLVGVDRPGAAQVFGGSFDRVVVTTYDDLADDLAAQQQAPHELVFVGVAAGPGMESAVDAVLALVADPDVAAGGTLPELAVEVPWELDALDHLRGRLGDPRTPPLSAVRRYRDRPCVVLGDVPAPVDDPAWVVDAVLTAGTTAPDARVSHQEQVALEWERAAAAAQLRQREAELQQRGEQLQRARAKLAEARRRPGARPGGGGRRGGQDRGPRPDRDGPAEAPAPAGPREQARRLLAALGRRVGRGARAGLAVATGLGLLVVVVPAVVLGLVAGSAGVAVGLALGVLLLGLVGLAALVALAHRALVTRLHELEQIVVRRDRDTRARDRRQLEVVTEMDNRTQRQGRRLRQVRRRLDGLPEHVTRTVRDDGLTVRRQVQALVNLAQMAPARAGVPALGGWAASPDFAVEVLDQLLERRPSLVVEAGSGVSTLLLALAAREHGLQTRIVSLDHDAHYAARTRELLARHGVADRAEVRWAPLARTHLAGHLTPWYDEAALADLDDVGLLVVDGPPTATGPAARAPAVPLLKERFAARCAIVVDDTVRSDDREVVEGWARLLPDFEVRALPLEKGAMVLRRG